MRREIYQPQLGINQLVAQEAEQSLVMEWGQYPFAYQDGIEILDNATKRGERRESMEKQYKRIRDDILTPPFEDPTVIATMGPTGSGKGGINMGFYRLLKNDAYLHDALQNSGVRPEIVVVQFALYQQAALLPEQKMRNQYLASPLYNKDHYHGISLLIFDDLQKHVLANRDKKRKQILLIESATYTSFPKGKEVPVEVEGIDRGNSVVYNLALDQRTKKRTFLNLLERDLEVGRRAKDMRNIDPEKMKDEDVEGFFRGDINYILTFKGQEISVSDLDLSYQRELLSFIKKAMAPPRVMEQNDLDLRNIRKKIGARTDQEYNNLLLQALDFQKNDPRSSRIQNPYLLGRKTYDLDYLLDSLPVRLYPGLLPKFI